MADPAPTTQHSPLYDYLKGMYLRGTLTEAALDAAVARNKITQAEADEIRATRAARDAPAVTTADAAVTEDPAS